MYTFDRVRALCVSNYVLLSTSLCILQNCIEWSNFQSSGSLMFGTTSVPCNTLRTRHFRFSLQRELGRRGWQGVLVSEYFLEFSESCTLPTTLLQAFFLSSFFLPMVFTHCFNTLNRENENSFRSRNQMVLLSRNLSLHHSFFVPFLNIEVPISHTWLSKAAFYCF